METLENVLRPPSPVPLINELVFTRYLYSKEEVKHSLLISMLDKNHDEALFWGYELYYSGFQEETFEYLMDIYHEFYAAVNVAKLETYLNELLEERNINKQYDWIVGKMIKNLIYRNYQVDTFIDHYMNVKCKKSFEINKPKMFMKIQFGHADMEQYKTVVCKTPRFILANACKYSIYKEVGQLFMQSYTCIANEYLNNWLYYASRSPIWNERIVEFSGSVNDETRTIVFENENMEEGFNDLYALEPDEQPAEIQEKSIGNRKEIQMSIKDFANKYGGNIICKKIQKPKK